MLNCCGIICEGLLLISLLRSRFLGCHATLPQRNFGGALRDIPKNGCGGDNLLMGLSIMMKKITSSKKNVPNWRLECKNYTLIMTIMAKIILFQYDQNGWKTIPFGAAHSYKAHIREFPHPPPTGPMIWVILDQEKTNSGNKHNKKITHGIFNLTFCMLQHTSSEVTVSKYDKI